MANLPTHRWKNETGLPLPQIAEKLFHAVCKGHSEIINLQRLMEQTTGEVRDAYKLVIHDRCWNLTQELFHFQNSMIGAITDVEYKEDNRVPQPREYCDGPTGAPFNEIDNMVQGCNGTTGEGK